MKNVNWKTIFGLAFGLIVAVLVQHFVVPKIFKPTIDSQLASFASEWNKNCPFMVDSDTRLDNIFVGEGKSIVYNYTLINFLKDEIDMTIFDNFLKDQILNTIKTNPDMKYLRDNDVAFVYNYKDKTSIHIKKLEFSPNDYK